MISETIWLILVLWIGLLAFSRRGNLYGGAAGMVGVLLALMLLSVVGIWLGIILIFFNIYVLYKAIFEGGEHP
jgi:predicted membrane protein